MATFNCIKCAEKYETNDFEPYYCATCNEERIRIAKEVDIKMANVRPKRQTVSLLQEYDNNPNKVHGFVRVKL